MSAERPDHSPGRRKAGRRSTVITVALLTSLSVAGLAGCSQGDGDKNGDLHTKRERSSAQPKAPTIPWNTKPRTLTAVGDSITRGFDACSLMSDCPKVSWSTGTDPSVNSLASRLLRNPSRQATNLARSGAKMDELPAQLDKAADDRPDLVTVMIGGNDACTKTVGEMTPVSEFRADFNRGLRMLREKSPRSQLYVASVPNLKRLWQQGSTSPFGVGVWNLGICQSMLKDAKSTDATATKRRETVHQRVRAYNRALREVCATDDRCRYDNGAVYDYRFTTEELSKWDYFHPSKQGQRKLSALTYRQIVSARAPH
ncbi:SGNH/GDSL hydrolase family protein [Streptomyces sp. NPDC005438]|uniref:SGNH/GDSL hydrolase family protein n=1 Tax=Streptomyces sp. NPDC005438 TaxID=3156880 RepID=UPI0033B93AD3